MKEREFLFFLSEMHLSSDFQVLIAAELQSFCVATVRSFYHLSLNKQSFCVSTMALGLQKGIILILILILNLHAGVVHVGVCGIKTTAWIINS